MNRISKFSDLKKFFYKTNPQIIGFGVTAFNRLGPEYFLPHYKIFALRDTLDANLIAKKIPLEIIERKTKIKSLSGKRNATAILQNHYTQKCLKKLQTPIFLLFYKVSKKIEKIARENDWRILANPSKFGKKTFENKIHFHALLKKLALPTIPSKKLFFSDLKKVGFLEKQKFPFVIQLPTKGGGKGTFFIKQKIDFESFLQKDLPPHSSLIVASYLDGPSPSITACVTKNGIAYTNLQYQILDVPECFSPAIGSGLFCGHDWSNASFSPKISQQAYQISEKIGLYLKKMGYRGIFGLDFVLDEKREKLYPVELNPRLLGSFPTLTMVQLRNREIPIIALHILSFLPYRCSLDIQAINRSMQTPKRGSQLILHNLEGEWAETTKQLKPGVYTLKSKKIRFERYGYEFNHLKKPHEFLIADGVPPRNSLFAPHGRIMRVLFLRGIFHPQKRKLTSFAHEATTKVYQALKIQPLNKTNGHKKKKKTR